MEEKVNVSFRAGEMRHSWRGAYLDCGNYMLAVVPVTDEDGWTDEVELYAEYAFGETPEEFVEFDEDGTPIDDPDHIYVWDRDTDSYRVMDQIDFDEYTHPILRAEIEKQAISAGIDPSVLNFEWE